MGAVCVSLDILDNTVIRNVLKVCMEQTVNKCVSVRTEQNVIMSVELVPVPPAGWDLTVKRDVPSGFTGRTVRRCASAGTRPSVTTSQAPAAAPPAGHRRTAFWLVQQVHLV